MKKMFIVLLILPGIILTYYSIEIIVARVKTPAILQSYLSEEIIKLNITNFTKRQVDILLKVEDPGFYSHKGVDFDTPGNGLTTISQSIAKKMYFKNFKSGIRKIKQTLIARFVIHPLISKEEQLNIFINTIWFENDCIGFKAAARYYFNKSFQDLTEDEYISLVAMLSAPKTFNLIKHPDSNKERSRRIKLLVEGKYKPKGLMDQYYGRLSEEEQKNIAPASYFEKIYKEEK